MAPIIPAVRDAELSYATRQPAPMGPTGAPLFLATTCVGRPDVAQTEAICFDLQADLQSERKDFVRMPLTGLFGRLLASPEPVAELMEQSSER